jgi:hypothetical protein
MKVEKKRGEDEKDNLRMNHAIWEIRYRVSSSP